MNAPRLVGALVLTISLFFSSNVFGQNNPQASLNEAGVLQIPVDQPLKNMYTFQLTGISFENSDLAVSFFEELNTEFVTFRVMYESQKAVVMIQRSKQPTWDVAEWNTYLQEITTANPIRN
ncbi:MAG: hypothetical protein ACK4WD_03325 [Flavobacteriales bacterium]